MVVVVVAAGLYLQADGQVDPGPEGRADSPGGQAQIFKQLREGVCEGEPGPLLCYHHTAPHTGQAEPSCLHKGLERRM